MIRHFLRNDSEEAELTDIIRGIPGENFKQAHEPAERQQLRKQLQKEDRLHWEQEEEKLHKEKLEEEERLNREQLKEEERLHRDHQQEEEIIHREHLQEEERLRREHQEEKLRREQYEEDEKHRKEQQREHEERLHREYHDGERCHREGQHEEERIYREKLEEKLHREHEQQRHYREQQEERAHREQQEERAHREQEERLRREQEERLHREQEERLRREQEEILRREQMDDRFRREQQHGLKHPYKEAFNSHLEPNVYSSIKKQIIEDEEEEICQTLSVLHPTLGGPPLSPSRPKSPWGKNDPYEPHEDNKEYVGFATLPNQMHRKYVKKGFEFTLMVAGESGLGKSTLINSLFLTDLYKGRHLPSPEECVTQTVEIVKQTVDIQEKGVRLRLTIVDTPGYGEAINNEDCWKPVADYIDQQFEQYFRDESGLNRKNLQDTRVHCCLYFLSPLGHGMRPLDIEFLRALQDRVNIVPILGKADSLTPKELQQKKHRIREELDHFGIRIYQFPDCDSDQDEEFKQQDQELKRSIPFAVIGSNTIVEVNGRRVRGRVYPWGVVEVENEQHCDFVKLRTMLIRTHMQDLKDVTRETHYENYRAQCIQSLTQRVVRERNRNKLTRESGTDFPIPSVPPSPDHDTQRLIREKDEELRRMQEVLQKMQKQMKDSQ
ncbi:septin-5-like isoform 2-T2 [Discoglossus pictus]